MKAFVGILAILAIANASVIPSNTVSVDEIKETLAKYDPARISDVSATLLDIITITLNSAQVSGFSAFTIPDLVNTSTSVQGTFTLPSLAANVDSLSVAVTSGLSASVPSLDASVSGLTVAFSASYTTSPLRFTALSALLQLTDVSVSGSVKLNDNEITISVGSDAASTINSKAVEAQDKISAALLNIVNQILSIIYP